MPAHALVPVPDHLHLVSLSATADGIARVVQTCDAAASCPICGQLSARVHSRCRRTLAGLPLQDIPARVLLKYGVQCIPRLTSGHNWRYWASKARDHGQIANGAGRQISQYHCLDQVMSGCQTAPVDSLRQ